MTPKVRTTVAYIQNWSRDNLRSLRQTTTHFQNAVAEFPAELGNLNAAVSGCLQSIERLQHEVGDLLESDALAELRIPFAALTAAEERQLLALYRQLLDVTRHLRTVVDDVNPRLEAKLADSSDLMCDFEIEVRIDYQLREDDPDFVEDDDNFLTTRTASLKHSLFRWKSEFWGHSHLPAGLLIEPHCQLFYELYSHDYGVEAPRLSFKDCLRIGRIFVNVQIWQQYDFNAQSGSPYDAKRRRLDDNGARTSNSTSSWSEALQQQTRDIMEDAPVTPDGRLHFKHATRGYAYVKVDELCHGRLLFFSKPGGEKFWFDDVDAVLQAGWVID